MERQRSFTLKPTRFLVFSFTVSSSIIFLTFFSSWLFKSTTPLALKETNLEFKTSSPLDNDSTGLSKTGNSSVGSFKGSVLIGTHLSLRENASGFLSILVPSKDSHYKSQGRDFSVGPDPEVQVRVPMGGQVEEFEEKPMEVAEALSGEEVEEESAETSLESEDRVVEDTATLILDNSTSLSSERIEEKRVGDCDVTKGKWVYDESYPLYTNSSCPLIDEGFDCLGNGRLDRGYVKWRWQPDDCDIPRFDASRMLDSIRGKRLVFVGDSINRNQWESMLCLLMGAVKDPKRVYETHGRRITKEKGNYSFKFVDYGCTVEYYVTHFLVHESKARVGRKRTQTLRIDAIDHGSSRWRGADVLIFNTAHWWSHFKTKAGINYYQEGNQVHPQLNVQVAFRRALMTWASWVDRHINSRKTKVFFRSSAPSHFRGGLWNSGGHCNEATQPLNATSNDFEEKNTITEEIIAHMKTPVTFLNITILSKFRIDGHPSIYGVGPSKKAASRIQDCSHWCLPGVPDTWNQLLYYHLQVKEAVDSSRTGV